MKNPVDSFAAALRAARAKRHLTQRALADNLHMSVRTIIEIELGRSKPRFETVALLAKNEYQSGCHRLSRYGNCYGTKNRYRFLCRKE